MVNENKNNDNNNERKIKKKQYECNILIISNVSIIVCSESSQVKTVSQ